MLTLVELVGLSVDTIAVSLVVAQLALPIGFDRQRRQMHVTGQERVPAMVRVELLAYVTEQRSVAAAPTCIAISIGTCPVRRSCARRILVRGT